MGETAVKANKNKIKQIKELVDTTIEFLKLISKYLGEAVAAIMPWRNWHKK